ncbi:MAG TPA: adenylosuccinate lyase [Kiritimatiellia bacterium]|nr:adenylosuccinate lyase [Kiritimatiellia bacterium]HMO99121.1 adenylosuccinate lyase [Kiritimatiellia bacterium]HMP95701.1 adenylosuccinate lyase [Kiritimatiellia bacterium]
MIPRYTRPDMAAIWDDENKFAIWLKIEVLACEAMSKAGIIPRADLQRIQKRAAFSVARINEIEEEVQHDVIAFLTNVAEHVGPSSRFIHKGMTSSDVIDTALAVQMVQAADLLIAGVEAVRKAAAAQARKHKFTPMIGRSHGIHAEPLTFGLKMALMYDEFGRALQRLHQAREIVRVGQLSGAVGTHAHLDPAVEAYVCKKLGLKPAAISTQILQRDRHADYMNALALVACSIDRWATEFRHLQRTEVRETEEFFSDKQKGSSAMPHKRNPIIGERLSGMARLIRGYAVTAMENVALWHERDISHSSAERVILPDATIALDYMLAKLEYLVRTLRVNKDRMQANLDLTRGLIHSQQVLLMLTEKGISRELAYRIVQRNAMAAWEGRGALKDLLAADPDVQKNVTAKDLDRVFDLRVHFRDVERTFKAVGLGGKTGKARR